MIERELPFRGSSLIEEKSSKALFDKEPRTALLKRFGVSQKLSGCETVLSKDGAR